MRPTLPLCVLAGLLFIVGSVQADQYRSPSGTFLSPYDCQVITELTPPQSDVGQFIDQQPVYLLVGPRAHDESFNGANGGRPPIDIAVSDGSIATVPFAERHGHAVGATNWHLLIGGNNSGVSGGRLLYDRVTSQNSLLPPTTKA